MSRWINAWRDRRRRSARPFILGELLIIFLLLRVFDYVKSLEAVRRAPALHNARDILSIEEFLHIDVEAGMNRWLAAHHTVSMVMVQWYQYSHITGTMIVLASCYIWVPRLYRDARTALVITNVVGMVIFVVLPVMPPRLLPHAGYIDSVAQAGYGTSHGGPVTPALFAAMPSLHLAWASWVAIVAYKMLAGKPFRELVFIYPVITTVAVISTGNHYMINVLSGVALTVCACWATGVLRWSSAPRTSVEPAPAPVPAINP